MSQSPTGSMRPALSIVVASVESERNLPRALHALDDAGDGTGAEVIVVDASTDSSADIARSSHVPSMVIDRPPGTLTPHLWAEGIRRSSGRWIALTTGHCIVPRGWGTALVTTLEGGAAAAGAGLLPGRSLGTIDLAVFFLRYHTFIDLTAGDGRPVEEIPGDNAAYRGDDLRTVVTAPDSGFFEVEHHRELRRRGEAIVAVPAATAHFGRSFPLATILRHRFEHGRRFGAWRTRVRGEHRLGLIAKAPLVPAVLWSRAWANVKGTADLRRAFLRSSPLFLTLACAWAVGEAAGGLIGSPGDE